MKFDFSKSTSADLSNKITINKLDILLKNVLYITHQVDFIRKVVQEAKHDKDLQTTVDKYFEETSLQTDSEDNRNDAD